VDVITFGPDKPRRPSRRPSRWPPRRAVVAGLAAVACVALLAAGIVAVRRDGDDQPGVQAAPASQAAPVSQPSRPAAGSTAAPCSSPLQMAGLVIDGVGKPGSTIESCDTDAVNGPWSVVVRRPDGSLGLHGAVVTFPVGKPPGGLPVKVNGIAGLAGTGVVTWPLAKGYARVRGDLDQATLLAIAARTTVSARRPQVRPPAGYAVVWSGPYRATTIHEVRYGSGEVGEGEALGNGLTYTGLTNGGGGFEDQLYGQGSTPGGRVGGAPAVLSRVAGGNATLAWEVAPGMVAYIGYSGAALDDAAAAALLRLAERARLVSLADWWFSQPQTIRQVNEPG
jgi:hypothetical protein